MLQIEKYEKIVTLVKEMLEADKITVRFMANGRPKFVIHDKSYLEENLSKQNINISDAITIITFELPHYIRAVISGDNFLPQLMNLPNLSDDDDIKDDKVKKQELIKLKLRIVEEYLLTKEIRHSYLVKTTSKVDCLVGIDWEINRKIFDDYKGKLSVLKYALLRLKTSSNDDNPNVLYELLGGGSHENSITFALDQPDIDHLVGILQDIKKALLREE